MNSFYSPTPTENCLPDKSLVVINTGNCQDLGAELIYTQDIFGKYLSFYWQDAETHGLNLKTLSHRSLEEILVPVNQPSYLAKITRIVNLRVPEQVYWQFKYNDQCLFFELVISPILPKEGNVQSVLVMGHLLQESESFLQDYPKPASFPDVYQKLLTNLVRNIRRTLDLPKIWQETVNGLGETLEVSRCLLIHCNPQEQKLEVKAEYCQEQFTPMLGHQLDLESMPYIAQAIYSKEPVQWHHIESLGKFNEYSVLVLSTFYENQHNGIICLQHCSNETYTTDKPLYYWNSSEIELVQKIADQVGTAIAHASLYRDLKQARTEAEEASRRRTEFFANTTHELRTPLTSMIGYIKLVLDGIVDNPEEEKNFLKQAYYSSLYLLNLINDILGITRMEVEKIQLDMKDVRLDQVFQDVEKITRIQAEEKNLYFSIKLPSTYDQIIVYGDSQRLLQIMLNLVGNSIKFTHIGGVNVSARIEQKKVKHQDKEFPGLVEISVLDTGIGVPLDKQDKLFESFFQTDNSRTKYYGGTGLGLSICKKLVEAMGGKISFYSMGEGLGSTITFTVFLNHIPVLRTVE